jgi:hypothetical protein
MYSMSQAVLAGSDALRAAAPHLELGREVGADGPWTTLTARRLDEDRSVLVRTGPLASCSLGKDAPQVAGVIARLKKLDHPALAKVEGGGVADGAAYLELDGVRGQPIGEFLAQRRLSLKQSLELGSLVCDALAYLHEQGIGYGALLPSGAWVARRPGSLRMTVKLVQFERVRKFVADGADQRAVGAVLLQLASIIGQRESAEQLRELGEKCEKASADAPRLKAGAAELRAMSAEMTLGRRSSRARHQAEALTIAAPRAIKATRVKGTGVAGSGLSMQIVTGVCAVIGVIVGIVSGVMNDRDLPTPTSRQPTTPSWVQPAPTRTVPSWAQQPPVHPGLQPGMTPGTQPGAPPGWGGWPGRSAPSTPPSGFDPTRPHVDSVRPTMPGGFPTPRHVPVGPTHPTPGMPGPRFGAPSFPSGGRPGFSPGGPSYSPPSPGFGAGS